MNKYSLGIADEEFIRGKVPMTKEEIRIITLAKARIGKGDMVVDVGAGTGSISCEAALQAVGGKVFAIERKPEAVELIRQNAEKFGIDNIEIIQAEAPEGMEKLPALDAAIIGGSGSHLDSILDRLDSLLKIQGRIVLNCVTVQTLMQSIAYMDGNTKYKYDTIQVQVNHWDKVGPYNMAKAANPIFIVTCEKIK